ncbi:MAG: hypothetical protein Q8936_16780 [Bacillota bacterium]|nr:hypothetical protein [Bacillota bacterium]
MDVVAMLDEILSPVDAKYGWYNSKLNTHVTFILLYDRATEYSDDEETGAVNTVQIDVWSKDDYEAMQKKNDIKKLMKDTDFGYIDGRDFYEDDTKIYHKALRYQILDSED